MGPTPPITLFDQVRIFYLSDPSAPGTSAAYAEPDHPSNPYPGYHTIIVNTASAIYQSGNVSDQASMWIHELMHVAYNMGYAVHPGWTDRDSGNPSAQRTNNNLIVDNCGVGRRVP
jgi:hypothetical protein